MKIVFIPMLSLQVFAEGGASEGGTGDGGTAQGQGVTAGAASQRKGAKSNPLAGVRYGIQTEESAPAAEVHKTAEPNPNAEFEALIRGQYKQQYDAKVQDTIQKRLKGTKETVDKYNALQPVLEILAKKHGVDAGDIEALKKAIESDDSYFEQEAMDRGLSVKQLKELKAVERDNAELRRQMQERKNQDKIPIISDGVEMALAAAGVGFFSSEKMSTTWLSQAKSAVDAWSDVLNSEGSVTVYGALYKTMRAVSAACGVSFSGVMRDGVALWNNTAGAYDSTLKIRTYSLPKYKLADELLGYLIEGDDRRAESLREEFDDADDAKSNLRTAIKNRFSSGEIDKSTALKYLVLYGEMDAGDALWKVEEWEFDKNSSDGEEFHKYDEFYEAVSSGKNLKEVIKKYTDNGVRETDMRSQITSHFKPEYIDMTASERASIKGYILDAMTTLGKKREDAEYEISLWDFEAENRFDYTDRKSAYMDGEITAEQLRKALIEFGGYDPENADVQIQMYDLEAQGYDDVTFSNVKRFNEFCKPAGVTFDTYY